MPVVHMPESSIQSLVEYRRHTGAGRLDECWDGVWHLTDPSAEHQRVAGRIFSVHLAVVEDGGLGTAWISINVTDREEGWLENHRCPDGAVILAGNPGRWIGERGAAFLGGPDLLVEVLSPGDETYAKLPFYAGLGVREVLIVAPDTGRPELWRRQGEAFHQVASPLVSEVTGLEYAAGQDALDIRHRATGRAWTI